jgi:hypothetical protein
LFKTMTGFALDSQHCARYRSTRRGLKSPSSAETSSTVSTLAASTCSAIFFPGVLRTNALRRGNTSRISAGPLAVSSSTAAQSPTAGQSASSSAAKRNFPAASAVCSPKSPATRQHPRCCATTRAGTVLSRSLSLQTAPK